MLLFAWLTGVYLENQIILLLMIVSNKPKSHSWTIITSAIMLLIMMLLVVFVPVPFVIWAPGQTIDLNDNSGDKPIIDIVDIPSAYHKGKLLSASVNVTPSDKHIGFYRVMRDYFDSDMEVLPKEIVYPWGKPADEPINEDNKTLDIGALRASAAALKLAGVKVEEMPVVTQVLSNGPADGIMQKGDLIISVDDVVVQSHEEIKKLIMSRKIGDKIKFKFLRSGRETEVLITSATPVEGIVPVVGLVFDEGYRYDPTITFRTPAKQRVTGNSLPVALMIYDRISEKSILNNNIIGSAGVISGKGDISSVGGIQERIIAAYQAGARVFVLPESSCVDVSSVPKDMKLVAANNLKGAVDALYALNEGNEDYVKGCKNA